MSVTINESGNFDVTDNYPDEIDTYSSEQDLYAAKLAALPKQVISHDR
jgi:hypothetical protein